MKRPIVNIEALKTVVQTLIVWLVVMGIWPMTEAQQAITLTLALAIVNLAGTFWETSETTPLAQPKAADGERLVRASGSTRSAKAG